MEHIFVKQRQIILYFCTVLHYHARDDATQIAKGKKDKVHPEPCNNCGNEKKTIHNTFPKAKTQKNLKKKFSKKKFKKKFKNFFFEILKGLGH